MISPSAIIDFLACSHLAALDQGVREGHLERPMHAENALLRQLGEAHEKQFLATLRDVTVIERSPEATIAAMRQGAPWIYQAAFVHLPYVGYADFLMRVERPSALGAWSYEAIDTKLARSTKASALLQLCFYSEQIARIQGSLPEWMHVELGAGRGRQSFRVADYMAYFRSVRREFEVQSPSLAYDRSYPEPSERCAICDWYQRCDEQWHRDDRLTIVAGITRTQRRILERSDVDTTKKLSVLAMRIPDLNPAALARIKAQARIQVEGREASLMRYELIEDVPPHLGLGALPLPSKGDVFFDIEADPYAEQDGLEYLLGYVADGAYHAIWALNRREEKDAFERFVDLMEERRHFFPAMHIYHYAPYEPTAIKRLAGRHNTRVEVVDSWLRGGVLVDLYRVLRQGLRASVETYSLKKIEALYHFQRSVELRDANASLAAFEAWLCLGGRDNDKTLLDTIAAYNKDDCFSTLGLREWLESLRVLTLPRPVTPEPEPAEPLAEYLQKVAVLADALTKHASPGDGRWVLAQLLEFHRREDKAFWWDYHRMRELSESELVEDRQALGGITYVGQVGQVKKSIVYRYRFPPQDHGIGVGGKTRDPVTEESAGDVVAIDDHKGTVDLKRGAHSKAPHPRALLPYDHVDPKPLSQSIMRLAEWVSTHAIEAPGPSLAARHLLLRRPPASMTDAPRPGDVLAVQGPPGAGKTYIGAEMILSLVAAGRRVGVTANSHRVISNMLQAVCKQARKKVRILQKAADGEGFVHPDVTITDQNNATIAQELRHYQIIAGTAWLWASEPMHEQVDVLVIDEAGQLSLANAVAAAQAAKALALLGDPQQLEQPLKGVHPPGIGVSALGHLLAGQVTLSAERGRFLPESRRMHPDVCRFVSEAFYEGRLSSHPACEQQRVLAPAPWGGTGLRYVPVEHRGNQNESVEEALRVAEIVRQLLRQDTRWIDSKGQERPLLPEDVLVVTPYNAHVFALREEVPEGVPIGTVDKFQGQEGAIVIYSMATSTPDDAPRGMEFLYSSNRLNVAISRARCVAILVASPALVRVQCKTPRQMALANDLCLFIEQATVV